MSHLKHSLEIQKGGGEKGCDREQDITQTESNEGIVVSVDNLDLDSYHELSCS